MIDFFDMLTNNTQFQRRGGRVRHHPNADIKETRLSNMQQDTSLALISVRTLKVRLPLASCICAELTPEPLAPACDRIDMGVI